MLHADGTGAETRIALNGPSTPSDSSVVTSVKTATDGTFLIHVPSGMQDLYIEASPFSDNHQTVEVKNGETSHGSCCGFRNTKKAGSSAPRPDG